MKIAFLLTTIFSFVFPFCLIIVYKKQTKIHFACFLFGTICFFVFANVLEGFAHNYFLNINQDSANFINSSFITFSLYFGFMAGIFEETGRLFAFKVLLKNYEKKEAAIAYGIGHGGIECILTLGVSYLMYTLLLFLGSTGNIELDKTFAQILNEFDTSVIPFAIFERIIALIIQISLSVIMFEASRKKNLFYLYPIAIILHALVDIPAGLYQYGYISSILATESMGFAISIIITLVAINIYKKEKKDARV